jgi:NAD(P)H dehydrogenase (quinone)
MKKDLYNFHKKEKDIDESISNSWAPKEREMQVFGDPLEILWGKCIFEFCGVKNFYRKMFGVIVTSKLEERQAWLKEIDEIVNIHFPALLK